AGPAGRAPPGPAVVFDSYKQMQERIDEPALGVAPDSVIVLRGAGPRGGPGMPEYGMLPIPKYLLARGIRDMVRISDARMSGTSYGACVLHVAPESWVGGPLALVRSGDPITLNVPERALRLEVDDAELARRRAAWQPPRRRYSRGYGALFSEQAPQPNEAGDFDFLARPGSPPAPEPNPQYPAPAGSAGAPLMLAGVPTILITGAAGKIGTMLR